jgi:hypothetical protein
VVGVIAVVCAFLAGVAVSRGGYQEGGRSSASGASDSTTATTNDFGHGPTAIVAGVPAGFARTSDGAVAAAAAIVTTGQALLDVDPLSAETGIRQMASMAGADRQVSQALTDLAGLREALRSGTGPIVFRQGVIATRLVSFTHEAATVEVWSVGVLARRGIAPPQAGWRTSQLELIWERGDWHLDSERVQPGPAPVLDDSAVPATADQFVGALDGFEAVTVAGSAAGAGS